jgi:TPP-dependent pyruvate/acetoin dehydrogenase alpha subunit
MTTQPGAIEISEATRLDLYRAMVRTRQLEKRAYDLFMEGLVQGTTHLGLGQEAVAAGFAVAMRPDDMAFGTYRGHNHMLLRGMSMGSILGECAQRSIGCCGGKGGSMHITDVPKGAMGSYAIVGAHLPVAVGTAWAAAHRGTGQVTVCFFGDGTTNIGTFHEAVNLAAIWKLPVVFVCENNLYMEYTAISTVIPVEHPAADRATAWRGSSSTATMPTRCTKWRRSPSREPGGGRDLPWWRPSPTGTRATPAPTPASTGPMKRWPPGWSAIPWMSTGRGSIRSGSPRRSSRR